MALKSQFQDYIDEIVDKVKEHTQGTHTGWGEVEININDKDGLDKELDDLLSNFGEKYCGVGME